MNWHGRLFGLTLEERFACGYVVDESGCWLWQRAKNPNGYGNIRGRKPRKTWLTHRLAWAIFKGPIPNGLCVLHTCDVRACVNPDHLFLGTQADNLHDMYAKGRANSFGKNNETERRAQ